MQDCNETICKGFLQNDGGANIPASFAMIELFDELMPDRLLWCGNQLSEGNSRNERSVSVIDSSRLEADTASLFADLQFDTSDAAHADLCDKLADIAKYNEGGAAFLMLLNTSFRCANIPLAALSEKSHTKAHEATAIFGSAITSAPQYQRNLRMFYKLPWAAKSLRSICETGHHIHLPTALPSLGITHARWSERNELTQLLTGIDSSLSFSAFDIYQSASA